MRRLDDFSKHKKQADLDSIFWSILLHSQEFLVQIFWPHILKFSLAFNVNLCELNIGPWIVCLKYIDYLIKYSTSRNLESVCNCFFM